MAETSLPVEHLFTIRIDPPSKPSSIRGGPAGDRMIFAVGGGTFEGEQLRGTVVGPAGDWVTARPSGAWQIDVRLVLRTDDGANILMQYGGVASGETLRTAPTFQTGAEQYSWLNDVQAIGVGRVENGGPVYDIYRF